MTLRYKTHDYYSAGFFCLVSVLIAAPAFSQAKISGNIIVDGRKTPSLIPNELALEHFVAVLASLGQAENNGSLVLQKKYLSFYFMHPCAHNKDDLSLSDSEAASLIEFSESLQAKRLSDPTWVDSETRSKAFRSAFNELPNRLGQHAASVLQKHFDAQVKPNIVITGAQQQP